MLNVSFKTPAYPARGPLGLDNVACLSNCGCSCSLREDRVEELVFKSSSLSKEAEVANKPPGLPKLKPHSSCNFCILDFGFAGFQIGELSSFSICSSGEGREARIAESFDDIKVCSIARKTRKIEEVVGTLLSKPRHC